MKKEEAKQVMDSLRRMAEKKTYSQADIDRDRKRLKRILGNKVI